jgi:F0F1-type ATP synthase epsilon subunit
MATTEQKATMKVKIYAPFEIYFEGTASSLSAVNLTGPFDILPHHKNFMSLLQKGIITVRQEGKPDFTMNITRGIAHVKSDMVTVFLDV